MRIWCNIKTIDTLFLIISSQVANVSHMLQPALPASVQEPKGFKTKAHYCNFQRRGLWNRVKRLYNSSLLSDFSILQSRTSAGRPFTLFVMRTHAWTQPANLNLARKSVFVSNADLQHGVLNYNNKDYLTLCNRYFNFCRSVKCQAVLYWDQPFSVFSFTTVGLVDCRFPIEHVSNHFWSIGCSKNHYS